MGKQFKKIYLEPENKTFSDIMGNSKSYEVPAFQRDYSWEQEQTDELWDDYENMSQGETQHFMGYLVLQTDDGEAFTVIDGQQRLTTITLMIIAALHRFQQLINDGISAKENEERVKHYHNTYLGVFNPTNLKTSLKLILNRNNKDHLKEMATMNIYEAPKVRNINASNRKLSKTLKFFQEKVREYSDEELINFLDNVRQGFLFTTITVPNDSDAFVVFETLNARGMHLSAPDLLKNYLFSLIDEKDGLNQEYLEDLSDDWFYVLDQLEITNFTSFLRSYHGMFNTLVVKKSLYRELKSEIKYSDQVFPYLRNLKKYAPIYAALQNPDDSFWQDGEFDNAEIVDSLRTLDLFKIRTPLSLLMAAYANFQEDFVKILKWVVVVSIRYNVICGKNAKEQERVYNELANEITKRANIADKKIIAKTKETLSSICPDDGEFRHAFSRKSMIKRHNKKILHLLSKIEAHCNEGNAPSPNMTVEHVLPYSPENHWQESFGLDTYYEARERLGNIALLPKSKPLSQEPFEKKRKVLKKVGLAINNKIAEADTWDIESLNQHQHWLAKQATAVWRIT